MNTPPKRPLSEPLSPSVNEARLARQWSAISARIQRPSPRSRRWVFAGAFAAMLVAVAMAATLRSRPREERVAETAPVHADEGREVITLPDGSRVTLDPKSRMALASITPERVHVVLESGGIALDIPRVEARAFVVSAANHQITVLGTAFHVRIEPKPDHEVLHVDVTRGTVQVARDDGSSRRVLGGGETWSTTVDPVLAPTASTAVIELPPSAAPPPRAATTVDGPKELLARATEARAQGRSKDAAAAFDQLRKRYRSDPRAGLAALELGRIRLDALGDAAGALEALDDALAIAPGAPLREDAEARRVDALDALSDPRCAAARASYLGRYPQGVHAKTVRLRCTPR